MVVPGWWSLNGGGHACSEFLSMGAMATNHLPSLSIHLHTGCMSEKSLQPESVFFIEFQVGQHDQGSGPRGHRFGEFTQALEEPLG